MASIGFLVALGGPTLLGGTLGYYSAHIRFVGIKLLNIDTHSLIGGKTDSHFYNGVLMTTSSGFVLLGVLLSFAGVCKMFENGNKKKQDAGFCLLGAGAICSFLGALVLSHKGTLLWDFLKANITKILLGL